MIDASIVEQFVGAVLEFYQKIESHLKDPGTAEPAREAPTWFVDATKALNGALNQIAVAVETAKRISRQAVTPSAARPGAPPMAPAAPVPIRLLRDEEELLLVLSDPCPDFWLDQRYPGWPERSIDTRSLPGLVARGLVEDFVWVRADPHRSHMKLETTCYRLTRKGVALVDQVRRRRGLTPPG